MSVLLQASNGNLYGTTAGGGSSGGDLGAGTIFTFSPGSDLQDNFRTLHNFDSLDGEAPGSPLIEGTDGNLYGLTQYGGTNYGGTIFEISTNGDFTLLYTFASESCSPQGLAQGPDGNLYGLTEYAAADGNPSAQDGTLFQLSITNQTANLTTLFAFDALNQDIYNPVSPPVLAPDGQFYAVAANGGANGLGAIFKFDTNGVVSTVVSFTQDTGSVGPAFNLGADGNFYGITTTGGFFGRGTVYKLSGTQSPRITGEPISQSVPAGSDVVLQVTATGSGPLSYQWDLDGSKISGATTNVLAVKNLHAPNAGRYKVIVRNSFGSTTSLVAIVTILVPPSITTQPRAQTPALGGTAIFMVKATGAPLAYLWLFDGVPLSNGGNISGSASDRLKIDQVMTSNQGSYCVIVSNSADCLTSKVVQLNLRPETTNHP
jgi:uncharacterized repeat protein (TIGR03803 family)